MAYYRLMCRGCGAFCNVKAEMRETPTHGSMLTNFPRCAAHTTLWYEPVQPPDGAEWREPVGPPVGVDCRGSVRPPDEWYGPARPPVGRRAGVPQGADMEQVAGGVVLGTMGLLLVFGPVGWVAAAAMAASCLCLVPYARRK